MGGANSPAYAKAHYEANKPAYKARAYAHQKAQRARLRAYVAESKAHPCVDCGVQYPHYVMQWDHVNDDKIKEVSFMVMRSWSLSKVQAEIAKCELVCANCHCIRTYTRAHP